jgi:hypothetical protein
MGHMQLARAIGLLGIPKDSIYIVAKMYKGAHVTLQTPYGGTRLGSVLIRAL